MLGGGGYWEEEGEGKTHLRGGSGTIARSQWPHPSPPRCSLLRPLSSSSSSSSWVPPHLPSSGPRHGPPTSSPPSSWVFSSWSCPSPLWLPPQLSGTGVVAGCPGSAQCHVLLTPPWPLRRACGAHGHRRCPRGCPRARAHRRSNNVRLIIIIREKRGGEKRGGAYLGPISCGWG